MTRGDVEDHSIFNLGCIYWGIWNEQLCAVRVIERRKEAMQLGNVFYNVLAWFKLFTV